MYVCMYVCIYVCRANTPFQSKSLLNVISQHISPPLLVAAPPYCLHHVVRVLGPLCQQGGPKMQPPRTPSGAQGTVCALKGPNFDTLPPATSQTDAARRPNFAGSPSTLWLSPPRVSPTLHSRGRALALQILQTEPASPRRT